MNVAPSCRRLKKSISKQFVRIIFMGNFSFASRKLNLETFVLFLYCRDIGQFWCIICLGALISYVVFNG